MAFWTDNNFEPKQDHQFRVKFKAYDVEELDNDGWYYAISCDRPSYQINEKVYKLINTQKKYPTNVTWSDINIEFVDTKDNVILSHIYNNFQNGSEKCPDLARGGQAPLGNIYNSPVKFGYRIEKLLIEVLDKEGENIETWDITGAWIKSFKQSQLNYQSDNISKISLTIAYDWAKLTGKNISDLQPPSATTTSTQAPSGVQQKSLSSGTSVTQTRPTDRAVLNALVDAVQSTSIQTNADLNALADRSNF